MNPSRISPSRISVSILASLIGILFAIVCSACAMAQTITEFSLPAAGSGPFGITTGPDGAVWFVEVQANKVGRITTAGTVTEFAIPTPNSSPQWIVSGPDGNLWFVEGDGNKIGKITPSGIITEYGNPTFGFPQCLTVGPDGNLWFADQGPIGRGAASGNGSIGRITTAGVITKFSVPTPNSEPNFITTGPDGALWFTYGNDQNIGINKIGRITTAGVVTDYSIPTPDSVPGAIVAGPDGALWFTENKASKIARLSTTGTFTEFPLATGTNPFDIVVGPDGALWFTEFGTFAPSGIVGGGQRIGRITTSGVISEFAIPTPNSHPTGIAVGPDGALWFGEGTANNIGRLLPSSRNSVGLTAGWNLIGNDAPVNVAIAFGDTASVITVWKWVASTMKWAFYAPSMTSQALADYAASKGYDVLTTSNGGEGFWVNAKTSFTAQLPSMR